MSSYSLIIKDATKLSVKPEYYNNINKIEIDFDFINKHWILICIINPYLVNIRGQELRHEVNVLVNELKGISNSSNNQEDFHFRLIRYYNVHNILHLEM